MLYYTVYKITNTINGHIYIGMHVTSCLTDTYMGSGKLIKRAIKKYGISFFHKEIIGIFATDHEMREKEAELVTEEFCAREDTYNLCPGGKGGFGYLNKTGRNLRTGAVLSKATKEKISTALKGRTRPKMSEASRRKLSQTKTGRPILKARGVPKTPEHREKLRQAMFRRWQKEKQS